VYQSHRRNAKRHVQRQRRSFLLPVGGGSSSRYTHAFSPSCHGRVTSSGKSKSVPWKSFARRHLSCSFLIRPVISSYDGTTPLKTIVVPVSPNAPEDEDNSCPPLNQVHVHREKPIWFAPPQQGPRPDLSSNHTTEEQVSERLRILVIEGAGRRMIQPPPLKPSAVQHLFFDTIQAKSLHPYGALEH
jgi:hypothetical protein